MTCLEMLRRRAEQESFNRNVLQELQKQRTRLQRKFRNLQIKGDHHQARQVQAKLEWLEKTEKSMKRLLGVSYG